MDVICVTSYRLGFRMAARCVRREAVFGRFIHALHLRFLRAASCHCNVRAVGSFRGQSDLLAHQLAAHHVCWSGIDRLAAMHHPCLDRLQDVIH